MPKICEIYILKFMYAFIVLLRLWYGSKTIVINFNTGSFVGHCHP